MVITDYVAFDLETTGLSPQEDEILEIAAVKFEKGEIASKWSTLVKPSKPVPLKLLRLTHIPAEKLVDAADLHEALEGFQRFREDLPLVGHNSDFDVQFLARFIDGFPDVPVFDTLELSRMILPGLSSYKLSEVAGVLGLGLNEAHRAYADAEACGVLFRLIQEKALKMPGWLVELMMRLMGEDWRGRKIFAGVFHEDVSKLRQVPLIREPWFQVPSGPGPERLNQRDSACGDLPLDFSRVLTESDNAHVLLTLPDSGNSTVNELIEHISKYADAQGKKVLLAGFPLKGILNHQMFQDSYLGAPDEYLCLLKLDMLSQLAAGGYLDNISLDERRFLASILSWAQLTTSGHISQIQVPRDLFGMWKEVTPGSQGKCPDSCPFADACYYLRSRSKTRSGNLFFSSLNFILAQAGKENVALFDHVVVWEFTDLVRVYNYAEPWVDVDMLLNILGGENLPEPAGDVLKLASEFRAKCVSYLQKSRWEAVFPSQLVDAAEDLLQRLVITRGHFRSLLEEEKKSFAWRYRDIAVDPPVVSRRLHTLESWVEQFQKFLVSSPDSIGLVHSFSRPDGSKGLALSRKALWPGSKALSTLLGCSPRISLLSKMVPAICKWPGLKIWYGVDAGQWEVFGPSGSENDQILTAVVDRESPKDADEDGRDISDFLIELAPRVSSMAVLFPSQSSLKAVYSRICHVLEGKDIAVFGQGVDGGSKVLEHLSEDRTVVLARLNQSQDLLDDLTLTRCIVIPRVPFFPPNPLDDLRQKRLSEMGYDGFREHNLSHAFETIYRVRLALQNQNRRCALVFLDPRLLPLRSQWGDAFLREISGDQKIVAGMEDVVAEVRTFLGHE